MRSFMGAAAIAAALSVGAGASVGSAWAEPPAGRDVPDAVATPVAVPPARSEGPVTVVRVPGSCPVSAPRTCLPVEVVRVERARRPAARVRRRPPPAIVRAEDVDLYGSPSRRIVTTRVCVDDGDGVTCRYDRRYR